MSHPHQAGPAGTVEIHGQHVPIPEIPDGSTALDVTILVRGVRVDDAGEMGDAVYSSTSPGTTFTTVIGMLQRHLWEAEEIARNAHGWEDDDQ